MQCTSTKLLNTLSFVMWSPVKDTKGLQACAALSCLFLHMCKVR